MAQRGATTFKKRQKEQERKERQQEKFAKRMDRKRGIGVEQPTEADESAGAAAEAAIPEIEPNAQS